MSYVIIFFITSHSFYFIIWLCYIYKYLTTGSNKSPASETQIQWAMTYMNQTQTHCIYHLEAIPTSHMSAIPTWSNRMTSVPASEQKSSCCTQMQQWLTNWRERLQDLPDRKKRIRWELSCWIRYIYISQSDNEIIKINWKWFNGKYDDRWCDGIMP